MRVPSLGAAGLLTAPEIVQGLNGTEELRPLGILALFISMVFMSIFLNITSFFEACARYALAKARTDGVRLFFAVYISVSILTLFTSNDIVILTFTPFVYYFAKHAAWEAITDKPGALLGLVTLAACIVALAPYPGISMWKISEAFALALLLILALRGSYVRCRATALLGEKLHALSGGSAVLLVLLFGVASALSANPLNNIPRTLAFATALRNLPTPALLLAALATAVGSNLGANITPIGVLAGIMWMTILSGKEMRITFTEFAKYGLLITPVALVACLGTLALLWTGRKKRGATTAAPLCAEWF